MDTFNREKIINNMCMTFRHDYGLMEDSEGQALFNQMEQIFKNDIEYHLMTQSDVDDYEETISALEDRYIELLQAVESKFQNESRHETALRYITQHERSTNNPVKYREDDD